MLPGMADSKDQREAARQDALRNLQGLERESDLLGRSALGQAAKRTADHFSAAEAKAENDPIELWGRRIGRVLSAIAFVALAVYLFVTYVR
jgi:hypothetical protein